MAGGLEICVIAADLGEFSACSNFDELSTDTDAKAVLGGVVCVSVIVAPRDILLMIRMPNDCHRDQNDGRADE